jgi:hypothetical protein
MEGLPPRRSRAIRTFDTHEFIRRFLMHVLPQGFHRIRLLAAVKDWCRTSRHRPAREQYAWLSAVLKGH